MQRGSNEENNAMKAALKDVSNLRRTEKNKHFETWSFSMELSEDVKNARNCERVNNLEHSYFMSKNCGSDEYSNFYLRPPKIRRIDMLIGGSCIVYGMACLECPSKSIRDVDDCLIGRAFACLACILQC